MAANASGSPQQTDLYNRHLQNLEQPLGPGQALGTTSGSSPQAGQPLYGSNNWYQATGVATIKKADGTDVPNPFDLTPEEIYFALSGHPDAARRLKESLAARGKDDLFHNIINYYEAGGGGFNGGGYTPEDAARAQANYMAGMGTPYTGQTWQSGMPVYANMADAAAGKTAGYATGTGMNYSATGAPATGGGGGGGTTPGTGTPGTGTTPATPGGEGPAGGSTQYGNKGDTGDFPMASAESWSRPTYDPYVAPTRSADIGKPFDFFNDEGYQFRLKEGIDGIQNAAAARGGLQSGNTLKSLSKYASGLASQEYGDAYNRFSGNRNFLEGQFLGDRNFGRGVYSEDRGFDYGTRTDERNYNNQNRMWDTTFNNANRIDARNFDYGVYTGDRDFNEGTRRWDLGFNYNAATGDRDFNAGNDRFLATLGANANNNYANAMTQLATLLSQLEMKGAGAGATGDIGAGNTLSSTIQQILATLGNYAQVNNPTTP